MFYSFVSCRATLKSSASSSTSSSNLKSASSKSRTKWSRWTRGTLTARRSRWRPSPRIPSPTSERTSWSCQSTWPSSLSPWSSTDHPWLTWTTFQITYTCIFSSWFHQFVLFFPLGGSFTETIRHWGALWWQKRGLLCKLRYDPKRFWHRLFIFVLFQMQIQMKLNFDHMWIKLRWRVWDLNPGRQDGRCRRFHWAMVAPQLLPFYLDVNLLVNEPWSYILFCQCVTYTYLSRFCCVIRVPKLLNFKNLCFFYIK